LDQSATLNSKDSPALNGILNASLAKIASLELNALSNMMTNLQNLRLLKRFIVNQLMKSSADSVKIVKNLH